MSYNLDGFGYRDRDGQGQPDDFKPEEAVRAVVNIIAAARPHVLVLQEIGDEASLQLLQKKLNEAGVAYAHADLVTAADRDTRLALLSQRPIIQRQAITNLAYSIREDEWPVQRGFQRVDVDAGSGKIVRIINVHLKSKTFHPAGQTEMRRNEARLLATHIRRLNRDPDAHPVIVCGDFSDLLPSAALRELTEQPDDALVPLSITDVHRDDWTFYATEEAAYVRHDYFLVDARWSPRWVGEKSGVLRDRQAALASSHRPLIAVFNLRD